MTQAYVATIRDLAENYCQTLDDPEHPRRQDRVDRGSSPWNRSGAASANLEPIQGRYSHYPLIAAKVPMPPGVVDPGPTKLGYPTVA